MIRRLEITLSAAQSQLGGHSYSEEDIYKVGYSTPIAPMCSRLRSPEMRSAPPIIS